MGSVSELCWTSAEDLFRELDLDSLYARQVGVLGRSRHELSLSCFDLSPARLLLESIWLIPARRRIFRSTLAEWADQKISKDGLLLRNYVEEQSE